MYILKWQCADLMPNKYRPIILHRPTAIEKIWGFLVFVDKNFFFFACVHQVCALSCMKHYPNSAAMMPC